MEDKPKRYVITRDARGNPVSALTVPSVVAFFNSPVGRRIEHSLTAHLGDRVGSSQTAAQVGREVTEGQPPRSGATHKYAL
jgi:hypothetical protein